MAWARRGNGRYYYRSVRVGNRFLAQYCGTGPVAEAEAEKDRRRRAERKALQSDQRELRAKSRAAKDMLDSVSRECDQVLGAVFAAAGYHEHHGEWRRRRPCRKTS